METQTQMVMMRIMLKKDSHPIGLTLHLMTSRTCSCSRKNWMEVSVTGIDDHEVLGLDIITCVALIQINHGKINILMHEYACYSRGSTTHSPSQIEWFHKKCDDKSHHVGGHHLPRWLCHTIGMQVWPHVHEYP